MDADEYIDFGYDEDEKEHLVGNTSNGADVTLTGVSFIRGTAKAVLVSIRGREHWIPRSQIVRDVRYSTMVVTYWIYRKLTMLGNTW